MTRFFLSQTTDCPSGAASHRDLHAEWGSSDMHLRGCDCDECCPGTKAQATRVYVPESQAPFLPAPMRAKKRQGALDRHTRYRHRKRLLRLLQEAS